MVPTLPSRTRYGSRFCRDIISIAHSIVFSAVTSMKELSYRNRMEEFKMFSSNSNDACKYDFWRDACGCLKDVLAIFEKELLANNLNTRRISNYEA